MVRTGDFNTSSSMIVAQLGIQDVKTLTQYAPILLSDDEPQITRLYEALMARVGLQTVSIPEGDKARDYILCNPVSLVISNLMKPHFTGLELFEDTAAKIPQQPVSHLSSLLLRLIMSPRLAFNALGGDVYLTKTD